MKTYCVLVAGGRGTRAGLGYNKVFAKIGGRSVLSRCLDALTAESFFEGIVLVLSESDRTEWAALEAEEGHNPALFAIANGGATRRESVFNGLRLLPKDTDIAAIHDAARPFVSPEVIRATLESAVEFGSGVISTPVTDTIKQILPDGRIITPDRSSLRAVQTPQVFRFRELMDAHERAARENMAVTDDASLYERVYGSVRLVEAGGAEMNQKLTTARDFSQLRMPLTRVGQGYDAHRLREGRKLILCGVEVPHDRGLDGHSDADVAVHALMDALLGALAEGDIGRHFPDSDAKYKGISSMLLLEHVMSLVREKGFSVINADVTIVAQRPKLAAFIPQMKTNLIAALHCETVNVKATTTERMGFEGEEIGISAQAIVLLGALS